MATSGDPTTSGGGPNAIQLYVNPSAKAPAPNKSGAFTQSGCIQDVAGRALTGDFMADDSMTVEMCSSFCSGKGFKMFGLE